MLGEGVFHAFHMHNAEAVMDLEILGCVEGNGPVFGAAIGGNGGRP